MCVVLWGKRLCVVCILQLFDNHVFVLIPSASLANGNVSLDVLPVKGPQGPAMRVAEPTLKVPQALFNRLWCFLAMIFGSVSIGCDQEKFQCIWQKIVFECRLAFFFPPSPQASEPLHRQSESWTIHPEQLVLAAPTISEWNIDSESVLWGELLSPKLWILL